MAPPKQRPYLEEVLTAPGRLRIAFTAQRADGTDIHPDCSAAVEDAAKLLESLGHHVEPASPEFDISAAQEAFGVIWWSGMASTIEQIAALLGRRPAPEMYEPLTWETYLRGSAIPAWWYLHAVNHMHALGRLTARFHERFDIWLTPCLAEPPPPIGALQPRISGDAIDFHDYVKRVFRFVPVAALANMTGQPAMSVPLCWNDEGLPIGVHFFGRFGEEGLLFRLAGQLERARPWIGREPPIEARS